MKIELPKYLMYINPIKSITTVKKNGKIVKFKIEYRDNPALGAK